MLELIDSVFEIDYEAREEISSFTEQLSKSLLVFTTNLIDSPGTKKYISGPSVS